MSDEKVKKQKKPQAEGKAKAKAAKGDVQPAAPKPKKELRPRIPSTLERKYADVCVPELMKQFSYTNRMEVPRLEKIVVNTSIKEALQDIKVLETACSEIAAITGQRPMVTKAKKSISNFKLRKGQSIGAVVTLRGKNMFEFMTRLVDVAMPRMRDFKGVSDMSFDGKGNYTLGLTEQFIFPEINFDKVQKTIGMNITFVTTAKTDGEGKALLGLMGMPFKGK